MSGVPDGYYALEALALVLETNEQKDSVSALVRIGGDEAEFLEAHHRAATDLPDEPHERSGSARAQATEARPEQLPSCSSVMVRFATTQKQGAAP